MELNGLSILGILIISFVVCLVAGKLFLRFLIKKGVIQPIYEDAPEEHRAKQGTPTMGGITFLMTMVIMIISTGIIFSGSKLVTIITSLIIIFGYGYIGFRDDYLKVMNRRNESGLSPKQKLILQFGISALLILSLISTSHETTVSIFGLTLNFGLIYYLIIPVILVGFSNATNLTDGLDGLLTTISIITFSTLAIIAHNQGNVSLELVLIATIGSLLAFLVYNFNPAKMFMGDTGSLVLGVIFGYSIVVLKIEVLGLLLGALYIFEVLSVMIQVSYFKYTKKKSGEGKRIFKMAPFHHHLEQSGVNEKKIVAIFAAVQLVISTVLLFIYM